ncbi:MAG: hypothetical protein PHF64_02815 [Methanoregula sp.]|nr:hypothetical protein [Methanoregula sp.]
MRQSPLSRSLPGAEPGFPGKSVCLHTCIGANHDITHRVPWSDTSLYTPAPLQPVSLCHILCHAHRILSPAIPGGCLRTRHGTPAA